MSEAYVLIGSAPGKADGVAAWLAGLPGVRVVRRVHYGHFDLLARLEAPSHLAVQEVIANKLRFHDGVERVEEIGDAEEAQGILHALGAGA